MSALAHREERDQLEKFDEWIERFISAVREEVEKVDPEQLGRLLTTTRQLGMRLDENLPPTLDPAVASEIRAILLGGIRKYDELQDRPIDLLDDLVIRAESIRHIIRDALDEDVSAEVDLRSKQAIARWLVTELENVPREDLSRLLGIDIRTFQRWLGGIGGPVPHRAQLVTTLVAILRNVWTPKGVVAWFDRERPGLGAAPIQLIDDGARERDLIQIARQGRAQHGS